MKPNSFATLFLSLVCASAAGAVVPLPPGTADRKVTLELKEANVQNLYRMLADLSGRRIGVDTCLAHSTVSLKVQNAPISVVLELLGSKLGVAYGIEDGRLTARCAGESPGALFDAAPSALEAPPAVLDKKVTIAVKHVRADKVLQLLAGIAGVKPELRTKGVPFVDIELHEVRFSTACAVLAETWGINDVALVGDALVALELDAAPVTDETNAPKPAK